MPLVRYEGNYDPGDRTGSVTVGSGTLVLGGDPVNVTDEEYALLGQRYKVSVVGAVPPAEADVEASDVSTDPVVSSSPVALAPVTDLSPSTPSASGLSTPTTPAEGN